MPFVSRAEQCDPDNAQENELPTPPVSTQCQRNQEQHRADGKSGEMRGFVINIEVQFFEFVAGK